MKTSRSKNRLRASGIVAGAMIDRAGLFAAHSLSESAITHAIRRLQSVDLVSRIFFGRG